MTVFNRAKKLVSSLVHQKRKVRKYNFFLLGSISFSFVLVVTGFIKTIQIISPKQSVLGTQIAIAKEVLTTPIATITLDPSATPTIIPTSKPTTGPTQKPKKAIFKKEPVTTPTSTPQLTSESNQYTAEKIDDVTWKVKDVPHDNQMATADEIVNALNSYRGSKGKESLTVDIKLSEYARSRADLFAGNGTLDAHAGFNDYMKNGGFDKAGFNSLGENSAYVSGPLSADKIVRQIFGADPSHDGNQLNDWTHVGIGVNGTAINVNFGKGKQ